MILWVYNYAWFKICCASRICIYQLISLHDIGLWIKIAIVIVLSKIHRHLVVHGLWSLSIHWWLKELIRRLHHERIIDNRLDRGKYCWCPSSAHLRIRISHFWVSMSIGTVFTKFALAFLNKKLAPLRFVIVIRNVHHFHLHFYRKWLKNN